MVVFILPEYSEETPTHFFHLYEMLDKIGESSEVTLVATRGEKQCQRKNISGYYAANLGLFSPLALLLKLISLRMKGETKFYVHYSFSGGIPAFLVRKIFGGKLYYWNCGYAAEFFPKKLDSLSSLLQKIKLELPHRLMINHSDVLVTGNQTMKEYYAKEFGRKGPIAIVPNWVNCSRFTVGEGTKEPKNVLFVHQLSKRKGSRELLKIIPGLDKMGAYNFIIIGDGGDRQLLGKEFSTYKNVELLGKLQNREVRNYFSSADVFIMPSEYEGFPRVLLESMASGVPYVAYDVGGVKELTPNEFIEEFVVPRGDSKGFVEKTNFLLERGKNHYSKKLRGYCCQNFSLESVSLLFRRLLELD